MVLQWVKYAAADVLWRY